MYEVVTLGTIKINEVSKELNIPIEHIKVYFDNYDLYKKFPLRDLTFQEIELISAIKKVKLLPEEEVIKLINQYDIDPKQLHEDQLLLERKMSRFTDDYSYSLLRKYQHFILEPAILHGNYEAPLTRPLGLENIITLLSNVAMGLTSQGNPLDPKTQISALGKIADIYTANKLINMNPNEVLTPDIIADLSPKELTKLIQFVKTNKKMDEEEPEKPKKESLNILKEFILFV